MPKDDEVTVYGCCVVALCRPVLFFLKENKINYKYVEINILKNEHLTPEFLKKNPKHTLPLLEDKGVFVSELGAIISHLQTKFNIEPLDAPVQSRVDELVSWSSGSLHWDIGFSYVYPQIHPGLALDKDADNNIFIENGIKKVCEDLDTLEHAYLDNEKLWLLGPRTVADVTVACVVVVLQLVRFDFKMWPKVIEWLARVRELPNWAEVHQFHDEVVQQIRDSGE